VPSHVLARIAATVLLIAAVGCGPRRRYPRSWPTFDRRQTCEAIAGTYRDRGNSSGSLSTSLSSLLLGLSVGPERATVTLSFPSGEELRADVTNADGTVVPLTLARPSFDCREVVTIRPGAHWYVRGSEIGLFAVGRTSVALELRRAGEYLVIRNKKKTFAVVVAIPWEYRDYEWYRFARVS
jgi:hypothetical protein